VLFAGNRSSDLGLHSRHPLVWRDPKLRHFGANILTGNSLPSPRAVTLSSRALPEPGDICACFDSGTQEYDCPEPYFPALPQ
jgi:hypothetical protein